MGEHQTKAKSRRHGGQTVQRAAAGPGYSITPTRSPQGALYSAAPAFGLGAPVQAKVEIGQAHDTYEREADAVSGHVLAGRRAPPISSLAAGGLGGVTQREEKKPEEKKEPVQRQGMDEEEPVQTQRIQREEKKPEENKEPVQRQGMDEEEPVQTQRIQREENKPEEKKEPVQRQGAEEEKEPVQTQRIQREEKKPEEKKEPVQRQGAEEEKEPVQTWQVQREENKPEEKKEPVQRQGAEEEKEPVQTQGNRENTAGGSATMADTAAHAIRNRGAGEPLDPATRQALEGSMGADLSQVRVHQDSAADEATRGLKARAFTNDNHIWLRPGESQNDLGLMAHEATHVVQQRAAPARAVAAPQPAGRSDAGGGSRVQRQPATAGAKPTAPAAPGTTPAPKAGEEVAPGEVQIKGQTQFNPSEPIASWLAKRPKQTGLVNVRFGAIGSGPVKVSQKSKPKTGEKWYEIKKEAIPLAHPLFARLGEAESAPPPNLILSSDEKAMTGHISLGSSKAGPHELASKLKQAPGLVGLTGFDVTKLPTIENKLEAGKLSVGLKDIPLRFGSVLSGTVTIIADDERVTGFSSKLTATVRSLASGDMELKRSEEGKITGKVQLEVQFKNFSGGATVNWDGEKASGEGKVGYKGEKLSGQVIFKIMPQSQAEQLEKERKPPSEDGEVPAKTEAAAPAKPALAKAPRKDEPYAVFGEGDLTFAFNDWLNGTAHVIVDHKGFVTVIGKITPQKEFPLFPPQRFHKELFKLEARAAYGIPVVGNVFVFANVGLSADAGIQGKFYNIVAEGTYSTDPEKAKSFSISGSLNVSAFASLTLGAQAGVGIEILGHDIKAGAGIYATVGVKGYAEATPIIGYREKGQPGEDKKGEFYIRGDVEVAAQAFLGLFGNLFVELDSPWWSPAPDKTWIWPLFGKEWPIGDSFGFGLTMDYVFGSGQAPALEFKKPAFSADKFMNDMIEDKARAQSAAAGPQKGKWNERNSKAAEPPTGPSKPGDAKPGKAAPPPPAQATVKPGGPKKATNPVDPNARTAEGKSVKDLKKEASKKGKKGVPTPKGAKGEASDKTKDPQKKHDEELGKGLAALDAVTARYAKDGATKEEVISGVKSVRRKFKVFKSITVIDGGETWDYEYVAKPGKRKGPKQKKQNRFKAVRRADGTIEGLWADFDWSGYPNHDVTPHPANARYGQKNGTKVPQPRGGKYVVGNKFNKVTPGAKHTDEWRQMLYDERDAIKENLEKKNPTWSKSVIDRTAKKQLEAQYNMSWLDLDLRGWEGHHIRPVNYWNGSDADSNFQYLKEKVNPQNKKTGEHSPFKPWWDNRQKEIESEV
jgi:hypothetical protein